MKLLGVVHVIELRALNFFVLATGVVMALRSFSRTNPESFTYLKGLGLGVLTGIIASVLFGLFVFIYTNLLDPAFMQSIIENEPFGQYLNPYIAGVAVAVEGIASGLILTFIVMNYMDTKDEM
jgi:H+/Cl- antiporter ClcA